MSKSILLLALAISTAASAKNLQPVNVRCPADPATVYKQCSVAFDQALQDKKDYEGKPEINLKCAFTINHKTMTSLLNSFMINCQSTAQGRAARCPSGEEVEVD